jgi:large subunit ribosomal protein L13
VTAKQMLEKQPSDLLKKAIQGMLPKTRLGRTLHNNFRIYNNDQHPHTSQNPELVGI